MAVDPRIGQVYHAPRYRTWYLVIAKRDDNPSGGSQAYWLLCFYGSAPPAVGWDTETSLDSSTHYTEWNEEIPGYEDSMRKPRGEYA